MRVLARLFVIGFRPSYRRHETRISMTGSG